MQVLKFNAWYKQTVHESPNEHYRVRHVNIYYYLEDDSISVVEPHVENSGMPQGTARCKAVFTQTFIGRLEKHFEMISWMFLKRNKNGTFLRCSENNVWETSEIWNIYKRFKKKTAACRKVQLDTKLLDTHSFCVCNFSDAF